MKRNLPLALTGDRLNKPYYSAWLAHSGLAFLLACGAFGSPRRCRAWPASICPMAPTVIPRGTRTSWRWARPRLRQRCTARGVSTMMTFQPWTRRAAQRQKTTRTISRPDSRVSSNAAAVDRSRSRPEPSLSAPTHARTQRSGATSKPSPPTLGQRTPSRSPTVLPARSSSTIRR
jgi:hypothetical protein